MIPIFIDTETTGKNPDLHGVVEVGICYRRPDLKISKHSWRCNPGEVEIDSEALDVNGMTVQEIHDQTPADEVGQEIRDYLFKIVSKHGPFKLLSYNIEFDQGFLRREPWWIRKGWWGRKCVMRWSQDVLNQRSVKLIDMAQFLGVDHGLEFHSAADDAHAAMRVWEILAARMADTTHSIR
jgi:DNA polymerase III epsilon subunit-like protein